MQVLDLLVLFNVLHLLLFLVLIEYFVYVKISVEQQLHLDVLFVLRKIGVLRKQQIILARICVDSLRGVVQLLRLV